MRLESSTGLDVSVLEAVLECGQPEARIALARQLAGLVADPEASKIEKEQVLPVLLKIAVDPEKAVRRALAEELATVPGLPTDVIFSVVADEDDIAIPFLKSTTALSGWHMVAILRVGDEARQQAVAGRADLSADARTHVLKNGTPAAVCAMVANPAVSLTESELRQIYTRLGQSGEVVEKLLAMPHLPPDVRILHAKKTAVRMRQLMAERGWLAANDAADLVADAEEVAVLKVVSDSNAAEQQLAAAFLAQNNMLTPSLIMRAACLGDMRSVSAALSHLTGQTSARIMDFISGRGGQGIRSLLNRSGLPQPCHTLIAAAADVAAEFRNIGIEAEPEGFGRRLLEMLMMHFGAMPLQDQAKQIEFVCRFAEPKVRKIARQLKIDMVRAA